MPLGQPYPLTCASSSNRSLRRYTASFPQARGLRERPKMHHKELASQLPKARELSTKANVLYPAQCFRDSSVPMRTWTCLSGNSGQAITVFTPQTGCIYLSTARSSRPLTPGRISTSLLPGSRNAGDISFGTGTERRQTKPAQQHDRTTLADGEGFFARHP